MPVRLPTAALLIALFLSLALSCANPSPTATPTAFPTSTLAPTPTPTLKPSPTATVAPEQTPHSVAITEIGGTGVFKTVPREAAPAMERGKQYLEDQNYSAALAAFLDAKQLAGEPGRAIIESYIGLTYRRLAQPALAIQHHTAAIALDGGTEHHLNRSWAYLDDGQIANAIEDANVVIAGDPITKEGGFHSHAEAYIVLAYILVTSERLADALNALDAALRIANDYGGYDDARIANVQADRDYIATYLVSDDE